jgi:hypothetical protein
MSSSAHIYSPQDDSLEARIHAYKTMRKELHNIEASQKLSQNKEWQDRLGTEEELQQAHNIIKNSLSATLNNIRDIDLQKAQEQGLMTAKEASELSMDKEHFENPLDSKQALIDKNKADIKTSRANTMNNALDKDNDLER